jgi:hypothetical protein
MLKMRRQIVTQITRCAHPTVRARLTQTRNLVDEQIDLLLLSNDHFIQLVDLVFGVAGFDFERSQALVVVAVNLHKA